MTKEQKRNSYEDDDFKQVLETIEGLEAERRSLLAEAAGKSSAIAKKIADEKKTATKLNIPKALLNAVLKQRKLEEQLQDIADGIPDDMAELYQDASGQFSFLQPDEGEPEPPAKAAATRAAKRAKANQAAEQEEGEKVLDSLTH